MKTDIKISAEIKQVADKISNAGFEVAVVGGAVRNLLLGKKVDDWDMATSATPEEIQKLFSKSFYNNKFGTVGVPVGSDGKIVEITTYRSEVGYTDRRHPDDVKWGKTLEDDLKRRDFTVNALALKFPDLELVDLYSGMTDLKSGVIRTVGDADTRFSEDALRLLRALRFATTLGFKIEAKTRAAISKNAKLIGEVSGERIRDEMFKILTSEKPSDGIMLCGETGLLAVILPELDVCFAVEQKSPKRHHIYDVGTHCIMSLANCPSDNVTVRLATLLHDVGKAKVAKVTAEGVRTFYNHEVVGAKQAVEIAERWHLSKDQRDQLFKLVRWHQFSVSEDQTDSAIRRFIKNVGPELVEEMIALRIGDRLGGGLEEAESWRLKLFRKRIKEVMTKPFNVSDLKINGDDVMKVLKLKPGPVVGRILSELFSEVLEDSKKNTKAYLTSRMKQLN